MNDSKVFVCLYSDPNFLAINLLEILLSKNCYVSVVNENVVGWESLTSQLSNRTRFQIRTIKDSQEITGFDYSIFCGGFIKKEEAYKSYSTFYKSKNLHGAKNLVLLPFECYSPRDSGPLVVSDNLSIVYVGDLVGPRLNLESNLLIPNTLNEILLKKQISLSVGEVFYPLFVADAAREISKWLFSFGPYGKEIFLLGPQVSSTEYLSENQRLVGQIILNPEADTSTRFVPRNYEVKTIQSNFSFALEETYKWFSKNPVQPKAGNIVRAKVENKKKKKYPKYIKPIFFSVLAIFFLPFLMLLLSTTLYYFSYKDFVSGASQNATTKILTAKTLFGIGKSESQILGYIPIVGRIYNETFFVSSLGQSVSDAALTSIPLISTSQQLFSSVLGDSVYDPTDASLQMKTQLNELYQQISKIQIDAETANGKGVFTASILLKKVDLNKLKNFTEQGSVLADRLPSILGHDQRKTYLILFQNNMELRPTGGFIGSFGLLTFDGGRLSDLTVNDVYSADGQLKGHVEPPTPIKNYLDEANWWLRDSNWDPDFPTSAQRAEWFLDKEMDQKVDGVFAIDLNLIRDALKITGPIFLADYNMSIDSNNLYEKTQAEAQEEFFPGSHQKASFLTALSRNLITEVTKMSAGQKASTIRTLYDNFEERHLQGFLHDDTVQNSLSLLGWAGGVEIPSCGDSCYGDLIGITEANVGVNKANYFITRQVSLNIAIDGKNINRKLTLNIKNNANPALGLAGKYKVYIRSFLPADGVLNSVTSVIGETTEKLSPEIASVHGYQEVGVLAEILQGQSEQIVYDWNSPLSNSSINSYGLYLRKQAGISDDPWQIKVAVSGTALTKGEVSTYNTILVRDFFSRINF